MAKGLKETKGVVVKSDLICCKDSNCLPLCFFLD